MKIPEVFQKVSMIQPVLTVVLIGLILVMIFQFVKGNGSDPQYREISRDLSFEEAARTYLEGDYEVYTRGTLIVKSDRTNALPNAKSTPTPTATAITAVENSFEDLFYFIKAGTVNRIDIRTYGQNESIFYKSNGEIVNLSNTAKAYTVYPLPPESDQSASLAYQSYKNVMQEYFPLNPLLKDFKDGKFSPVLRSKNIYSGKWKHYLYTSDEVVDVIVQTEPETGLFRSFLVVNGFTTTPSEIYFDFRKLDNSKQIDAIPAEYKKVDPVKAES